MNRHTELPGLINFRELGHYRATDLNGQLRKVKAGCLFRAGHLHDASPAASAFLADLAIDLVVDFRTAREQQQRPNAFGFEPAPDTVLLPVEAGGGSTFQAAIQHIDPQSQTIDGALMAFVMQAMNRSLLIDHAHSYGQFFHALLARQPQRLLLQCASGKDRTGIASALLLAALGVDRDIILADYLLSNLCLKSQDHVARATEDYGDGASTALGPDALAAMYQVRPAYLEAVFDSIDQQWGSSDIYLAEMLGVDAGSRELLQSLYLQAQ